MSLRLVVAGLFALPVLAGAHPSRAAPPAIDRFLAVAVSPDGAAVATIEQRGEGPRTVVIRDRAGRARIVTPACPGHDPCVPSSPAWLADGRLGLVLNSGTGIGEALIDAVDPGRGAATVLARFDGPLAELRAGPDGRLAVLATAHARKRPGATAAASAPVGVIGSEVDEQRIATIGADGHLRFASPPGLYVYHYDWLPDGRGFVGIAAAGDGDSQWWVASLFRFGTDAATGPATVLYRPPAREQLADPVVAPDGRSVAFIGGWMSDEGSTGGDLYRLALDRAGARPVDLMPGSAASAVSIDRACDGDGLVATLLDGTAFRLVRFGNASATPTTLWSGGTALGAGGWNSGISCGGGWSAASAEDFTTAPELVGGPIGHWRPLTTVNRGARFAADARSLSWTTDPGWTVTGWLLTPRATAPEGGRRALVVLVHGGPQAAAMPEWVGDRLAGALLRAGFDVVLPNYRGSFGGGERFATGSIGDIGGGDWRDVLASVGAAEGATPIDDGRVGIAGGSYGGYMAMWAVSQTRRFAAAASAAGVSDWLSIEGEAPQAGSDPISFGATVYDDPGPYLRASPVMHIKGATTPTLITVGDRDAECPEPQSEEFATALEALGVPHEFVVYRNEGHGFSDPADAADEERRTVAWFVRWLDARRPART